MSALEDTLAFQLKAVGLPEPVRELHFDWCCEHPKRTHSIPLVGGGVACVFCSPRLCEYRRGRDWRFDFAWPDLKLAVEVDGGTRSGGRHVRPFGAEGDMEKYNRAIELGWRVLRFPAKRINDGSALNVIEGVLKVAVS